MKRRIVVMSRGKVTFNQLVRNPFDWLSKNFRYWEQRIDCLFGNGPYLSCKYNPYVFKSGDEPVTILIEQSISALIREINNV